MRIIFFYFVIMGLIASGGNASNINLLLEEEESDSRLEAYTNPSYEKVKEACALFLNNTATPDKVFEMLGEACVSYGNNVDGFKKIVMDTCGIAEDQEEDTLNNIRHHRHPEEVERLCQSILAKLNNDPEKINKAAENYWYGWEEVAQDQLLSFYLYKASAELGDKIGLYNVAIAYDVGIVIKKDKALAMHYYEKAGEKNHPFSSCILVDYYIEDKKYEDAWFHLSKVGNKFRNGQIYYKIATLYERKLNISKAVNYYKIAAVKDYKEAIPFVVVACLYNKNYEEALFYLRKMAVEFKNLDVLEATFLLYGAVQNAQLHLPNLPAATTYYEQWNLLFKEQNEVAPLSYPSTFYMIKPEDKQPRVGPDIKKRLTEICENLQKTFPQTRVLTQKTRFYSL